MSVGIQGAGECVRGLSAQFTCAAKYRFECAWNRVWTIQALHFVQVVS